MHLRAGFGDRVKRKGTIMHVLSSILNINARPNIGTHANEDNTKITSTDGSKTKHDPRLSNIFIPNETIVIEPSRNQPTRLTTKKSILKRQSSPIQSEFKDLYETIREIGLVLFVSFKEKRETCVRLNVSSPPIPNPCQERRGSVTPLARCKIFFSL